MKRIAYIALTMLAVACGKEQEFDAQGTFEATEIIVSSEATGRILSFNATEGTVVKAGTEVGAIDSLQLFWQRKQLMAQQAALLSSRPDVKKQVASLREQIGKQKDELRRVENMLRDGAATQKQQDDIEAHIRVLERQMEASLSTLDKNTASINDNVAALEAQISALDDRIDKCRIIAPTDGTVLVKYAEAGELATVGKPLMKIADLGRIYLRAYITAPQLSDLQIGQPVTVFVDQGEDGRRNYEGKVTWIADKAEFTPKTIQTRDERANLVYAIKIAVTNDGLIKQGMYGDVKF